jgi:hypothetical protein
VPDCPVGTTVDADADLAKKTYGNEIVRLATSAKPIFLRIFTMKYHHIEQESKIN